MPGSSAGCLPLALRPRRGGHCAAFSGSSRCSRATTRPRGRHWSTPRVSSGRTTYAPATGSRCSMKGEERTCSGSGLGSG
eukprot:scaffold103882_cov42-Phaeocystis_antarctica.AAC.1